MHTFFLLFKYFHIFLPVFTFLGWLQLSKKYLLLLYNSEEAFKIVRKIYLLLRGWSFNSSKANLSDNLDGGRDPLNFHTLPGFSAWQAQLQRLWLLRGFPAHKITHNWCNLPNLNSSPNSLRWFYPRRQICCILSSNALQNIHDMSTILYWSLRGK